MTTANQSADNVLLVLFRLIYGNLQNVLFCLLYRNIMYCLLFEFCLNLAPFSTKRIVLVQFTSLVSYVVWNKIGTGFFYTRLNISRFGKGSWMSAKILETLNKTHWVWGTFSSVYVTQNLLFEFCVIGHFRYWQFEIFFINAISEKIFFCCTY